MDNNFFPDDFADELFESYFDGEIIPYGKETVRKHFKKYLGDVNQIISKELTNAQTIIYNNITLQSEIIRNKTDKQTAVIENIAENLKRKQEKGTTEIIKKIDELGISKVPVISMLESQIISISQCSEEDTKYNLFGNTVVLDRIADYSEYEKFAIELFVDNIGAVAIEKIILLEFKLIFYEMEKDTTIGGLNHIDGINGIKVNHKVRETCMHLFQQEI